MTTRDVITVFIGIAIGAMFVIGAGVLVYGATIYFSYPK
jgi:hypothetical protein